MKVDQEYIIIRGMMNIDQAFEILTKEVQTWFTAAIEGLPNFLVALLVMVGFVFLAKGVRPLMKKTAHRWIENPAVENLLNSLFRMIILSAGLFISLGILNLDKTVTSLLAGAGVIGLALGFAFQEIASNFVSGILIAFRKPYQIGDIVEVDGYQGEVKSIELRTTRLMLFEGNEVLIPNKTMFTDPLINYTTTNNRRVSLKVGVSYQDDLEKVKEIVHQAILEVPNRLEDRSIDVLFYEFADSSINFDVRFWVKYPHDNNFLKAKDAAIISIKKHFDQNEISIPFPIRTLELGNQEKKVLKSIPKKMSTGPMKKSHQEEAEDRYNLER